MTSYPGTVIVHKRKSPMPTGTVELDGVVIGHVVQRSRIAAGTGGKRQPFFTAVPIQPYPYTTDPGSGMSIGTRFPTRRAAARALVDFAKLRADYGSGWSGLCRAHRAYVESGARGF